MMQSASLIVTGMRCGGCSTKIAMPLNAVGGVEDVQVSLASGQVTVRYDEQRTSSHQLGSTVINSGFGVNGMNPTNGHDPRPDACG